MHPDAVDQALEKLERARAAVERIVALSDAPGAVEGAWVDFLLAASSIYSKLEQGAKHGSGKSAAWFGRKKSQRKTDPLLRYIHHARNAEEHGIERVTRRASSRVTVEAGTYVQLRSDGENWNIEHMIGSIQPAYDRVALVPVRDSRFGDIFQPPWQHLGQTLPDRTPKTIATLGLSYLERMIEEAATV
jgi:hypothetical protein